MLIIIKLIVFNIFLIIYLKSVSAYKSRIATIPSSNERDMIGTFRFKRIGKNSGLRYRKSGWNVSGCYCHSDQILCDCGSASNRVRYFIGQKGSKNKSVRNVKRIQSGCYCDLKGCHGEACEQLNGCVCNTTGECWGNNCPYEYEATTTLNGNSLKKWTESIDQYKNARKKMAMNQLTEKFDNIENENIFAENNINPIARNIVKRKLENSELSSLYLPISRCMCDHTGCEGRCEMMNGCVCIGAQCWGSECRFSTLSTIGKLRRITKFSKQISPNYHYMNAEFPTQIEMANFGKLNDQMINKANKSITMKKVKAKNLNKIAKVNKLESLKGSIIPLIRGHPMERVENLPIDLIKSIDVKTNNGTLINIIKGENIESTSSKSVKKVDYNNKNKIKTLQSFPLPVNNSSQLMNMNVNNIHLLDKKDA